MAKRFYFYKEQVPNGIKTSATLVEGDGFYESQIQRKIRGNEIKKNLPSKAEIIETMYEYIDDDEWYDDFNALIEKGVEPLEAWYETAHEDFIEIYPYYVMVG